MIGPEDRRHGTYAGHVAGCRDDCCTTAARNYQKRLVRDHERGIRRRVDATGTRRRIHALRALGWPVRLIGQRAGVTRQSIAHVARQTTVLQSTADRIARVYAELSNTTGPDLRSRKYAERMGWVRPIMWDDETIDDPNAKPWTEPKSLKRDLPIDEVAVQRALTGDRTVRLTKQERLEVVRRWQAAGKSIEELNRIHGWNAQRDLREIRSAA
jgi:hypothetical protein